MSDGLDPYDGDSGEEDIEEEEEEIEEEEEYEEEPEELEFVPQMSNISGVGPKTAEKLAAAGFDSVQKVADATAEKLAELVAGMSAAKAEAIIAEAANLLKEASAGTSKAGAASKKSKRKKSTEPEPTKIELPPMKAVIRSDEKIGLATGLEKENAASGVPIGPRWLTKFERARIIGARALQISMGAPPLIVQDSAPKELFAFAEQEMKAGVLPMTVRRTLPTGEHADIPLSILLKTTRLD